MLRTPLCDWHHAHSGRMVEFAGWEMPIQYASIVEEHTAVRERVGLFDIAHMGRVFFSGPDAMSLLDHLLTNDVTQLKSGQVRYSLMCNRAGGILDDVLVYRLDGGTYMLVVNASNRAKVLNWIEHHMEGYTLSVVDETESQFMLALQGPRALDLLQPLTEGNLATMKYYSVATRLVGGAEAIVSRTGYTGEDGFEVIVPNHAAKSIWERICEAGKKHGLAACGLGCRDTLRLEAAMPLYGHELDDETSALEAGLSRFVKLDKEGLDGPAVGIERLRREATEGVPRKLVGLVLEDRGIARDGMAITVDGTPVGRVTSGALTPTLDKAIALGYVPPAHGAVDSVVAVDIRGRAVPARIVRRPFYKRPRG